MQNFHAQKRSSINILIVEATNALLRGVVHHIFDTRYTNLKYKVFQAYKGKTALEALNKNDIDLAFLDIELPDHNGLDLLNIINADFKNCKTIMVSAYGTRDNVATSISKGVLGFVVKPFNKIRVQEPVDKFMDLFRKKPKRAPKTNKEKLVAFVRENYG